jgi:hypothetical protein
MLEEILPGAVLCEERCDDPADAVLLEEESAAIRHDATLFWVSLWTVAESSHRHR